MNDGAANTQTSAELERQVADFREGLASLKNEIHKVIIGQDEIIDQIIIALFAGGHVLLEGVPGLGKTLMVKTLSQALSLQFSRVQFTPDLMPADITGTNIVVEDERGQRSFQFQRGPVFGNVLLADEINRATPKTQSALLEAMQEGTVTAGGQQHSLPQPFFVMATQNPIEMEGTYPLPEAQLDRFLFKLLVRFPDRDTLLGILDQTTGRAAPKVNPVLDSKTILNLRDLARDVIVATQVAEYAVNIVLATHPESPQAVSEAQRFLRFGSSPRGGQAIILAAKVRALLEGRFNVSFEDVRTMTKPALRHRIIMNFEGEAEGLTTDAILDRVLDSVKP
ncbi:MAG: MoxR family ATPase [Planctomycetota bacterium]